MQHIPKRLALAISLFGVVTLALMGLAVGPFQPRLAHAAAPYIVTNPNDSGPGSLRQAIADATASGAAAAIVFDVSLTGQTITLTTGALQVSTALTIKGLGATSLAISGNHQSQVVVVTDTGNLTLSGVTIEDGIAGGPYGSGGGIENLGTLSLKKSTVSNNGASSGGGIASENGASLTLSGSTVSGNIAGSGGGIEAGETGMVTLTNSTVSNNWAELGLGGGVDGGVVTVTSSTVSGNTASFAGGGINGGSVTVTSSTVSGNSASGFGGGINGGALSLAKSIVSNNQARLGGGIYLYPSTGYPTPSLTLSQALVTLNIATDPSPSGGGVYNLGTVSLLSGSAITANSPDDCVDANGGTGC